MKKFIKVELTNVSREEVEGLKVYLEEECWGFKVETESEE